MTFTPRSHLLHVRVNKRPDRSPGGIYLPQIYSQKATEGTVIRTGPGRQIPGVAGRAIVWVMDGEIVLFAEHDLRRLGDTDEGLLTEDQIIATVEADTNRIYPEGEWVLIDPDPAPATSALGIHLSDRARRAPLSGRVADLGPGELRLRGEMAGLRQPIKSLWGLAPDEAVIGRRVWWSGEATFSRAAAQVLVKARDVLMLEVE